MACGLLGSQTPSDVFHKGVENVQTAAFLNPTCLGSAPGLNGRIRSLGARKEDLEVGDPLADTEREGLYAGALGWAFKVPVRGLRGL